MTLFDSNAEVQVEHLEGEITGSQSEKSAYLFAGVMPDNSASFVKMTNSGHLLISGTVGIQDVEPLTIGSFFATASVKIVESFITQSITGSVEIINFPLVQEVTGTVTVSTIENPISVNQNNSGSIPWKVVLKDEQGETVGSGSNPLVVRYDRYYTTNFGQIKSTHPYTLADFVNTYGLDTFEFSSSSIGGGTITTILSQSATRLSVGSASGDAMKLRTNTYYRYQAGKEQTIKQTVYSESGFNANQIRRWGYFSDNDGLFWYVSGSNFGIATRSTALGNMQETIISQSAWNVNRLDGTQPNSYAIDLTKSNIYEMTIDWLGVGKVCWFVNGTLVHEQVNYNIIPGPYMRTAMLPISFEIENTGASSPGNLVYICSSIESQGGGPPPFFSFTVRNETNISVGTAAEVPLLAIRPGVFFKGGNNRIGSYPRKVSISTEGARIAYRVILNPTITGGTWISASQDRSSIEYNNTITSFTGGETVFAGFLPNSEDADVIDIGDFFGVKERKLVRNAFTTDTDRLLVVAINQKAGTTNVRAGLTWDEVR
jgi:hypothetical protein